MTCWSTICMASGLSDASFCLSHALHIQNYYTPWYAFLIVTGYTNQRPIWRALFFFSQKKVTKAICFYSAVVSIPDARVTTRKQHLGFLEAATIRRHFTTSFSASFPHWHPQGFCVFCCCIYCYLCHFFGFLTSLLSLLAAVAFPAFNCTHGRAQPAPIPAPAPSPAPSLATTPSLALVKCHAHELPTLAVFTVALPAFLVVGCFWHFVACFDFTLEMLSIASSKTCLVPCMRGGQQTS